MIQPALTQEGACHLLADALVEGGLYQNEEHPLEYKINTYEITKSSRMARSVSKDQACQL